MPYDRGRRTTWTYTSPYSQYRTPVIRRPYTPVVSGYRPSQASTLTPSRLQFGLQGTQAKKVKTPVSPFGAAMANALAGYGQGAIPAYPTTTGQAPWNITQQGWQPTPQAPVEQQGQWPYSTAVLGAPSEPWYMSHLQAGGTAGRAAEIHSAWLGGGRPAFIGSTVASVIGVSDEDMNMMGYERTMGGGWRAMYPTMEPAPEYPMYGGGYGGGGGGYSYPTVQSGRTGLALGLVNWRIGL